MSLARTAAPSRTPAADPEIARDLDVLGDLVARARRAGADAADALLVRGRSVSTEVRLGRPEKSERAEGVDLGLRVLIGRRQAQVSSSDLSAGAVEALVGRAVAMAHAVPEDEFCGIAEAEMLARSIPDLAIDDPREPSGETLQARALAAEAAALAVAGVTNSGGADASYARSSVALVASNGFAGGYASSRFSVSVSVIAGEGTGMERDYEFSSVCFEADLDDPAMVGREAGERAVRRLSPRKPGNARVPVVFDPRVSSSLIGHLAGAINGVSIARGTSFLKDKRGERIFPAGVRVVDEPHRPRGMRSRPFDAEGLPTHDTRFVDDGVLTGWVLDLRSARQLGLAPTGHAVRDTSGPPGPATTNLYLAPGTRSRAALLAEVGTGLYVTELMGMGVNGVTGDYSRGAAGFWIEGGVLAYPVSEITIAGNLKDMYLNLTPADDLAFRYGTNAPTVRVDGMTIAGG